MKGGGLRAGCRRTATLVAAVVVLLLGAAPVEAHSELERSDPPNGGMVSPGRDFITLWFGEPISASASRFDLHLADGTGVDAALSSVDGDGTVVHLDTAELARGSYELQWRVISLDDGHPASGTLVFGVGLRPDVVPAGGSALPAGSLVAVRWLDLSAIMLAIGALAVSGRLLTALGEVGRDTRRRARSLATAAAVTAAYTGLLTPLLRTRRPGNPVDVWLSETWGTVTGTPWGHVWLARQAAVLLAVAAVWSWTRCGDRAPAGPRRRRVALAALGLVALLEAGSGHAADLPDGSGVAVLASAAHLLAAGVWAGGLAVLALCVVPLVRAEPDLRGPVVSTVWRGFSPMAAVASVVLLATGLYEAGVHVPGTGFLRSTVYGGAVTAKTVLVVVALALAGLNTLLVHPRLATAVGRRLGRPPGWAPLSPQRFTSLVAAEAVVLVVGVAAAAVVTSVPTAREVAAATRATAPHHEDVNGLYVTFEDLPAGPDRATLLVRVRPTVLPEPAPVVEVRVALTGPGQAAGTVALVPVEAGRYEAATPRPGPGAWTATVTVVRPGMADTVTHARWTVADPGAAGTRPFRLVTTGIAVLLLLGLLVGLLIGLGVVPAPRRRRAPLPVPAVPTGPPEVPSEILHGTERSSR